MRLERAARDSLSRAIDSAKAERLPVELLVAKAAEGVLKGASDAQIVRAVRTLVKELSEARRSLPMGVGPGTLSAAASALHTGVTAEMIRSLWDPDEAGVERELAVALVTLADLVAKRVPAAAASNAVGALLRRHASESAMDEFRNAVAADILAGQTPRTAVVVRTTMVLRGLPMM